MLDRLLDTLVGGVGGAVLVMVTLRTRLARMDWRMTQQEKSLASLQRTLKAYERRQIVHLQLTASVARKLGVDARFDDVLVRFLTEDENAGLFHHADDVAGGDGDSGSSHLGS